MDDHQIARVVQELVDLGISPYAANKIKYALENGKLQLKSVDDLRGVSKRELLTFNHLGDKSLKEIRDHFPYDPNYQSGSSYTGSLNALNMARQWLEAVRHSKCPECGSDIQELVQEGSTIHTKPCNHKLYQGG